MKVQSIGISKLMDALSPSASRAQSAQETEAAQQVRASHQLQQKPQALAKQSEQAVNNRVDPKLKNMDDTKGEQSRADLVKELKAKVDAGSYDPDMREVALSVGSELGLLG